jgi:hypothetical protein
MMMLPDKKKMASIIVAKIKPGKSQEEVVDEVQPGEAVDDKSMALEDAASMMMQAVEKKDAKMMVSALKDFIDMCEMKEESYESEE